MRIYYLLVCLLQGSESSDTETEHLLSPVRVRRPDRMLESVTLDGRTSS